MSTNISDHHLRHASYLSMEIKWNTFTQRQQTSILKQVRTGVHKGGNCATSFIARSIINGYDLASTIVDKWEVTLLGELPRAHPIRDIALKHYQMAKVITQDADMKETIEQAINDVEDDTKVVGFGRKLKLFFTGYPYQYHRDQSKDPLTRLDPKFFRAFKKQAVYPVSMTCECKQFVDDLKEGKLTKFIVQLGNSYDYARNSSVHHVYK